MKSFLFYILTLSIPFLTGCASTKNNIDTTKVHIIDATYHSWTEKLPDATLPESGTDLQLAVTNWAANYNPEYVIFNHYKSHAATIADSSGNRVQIQARIIRTSSVMMVTAQKTTLSDRLVFTTAKGDTSFIEIEEWERAEK